MDLPPLYVGLHTSRSTREKIAPEIQDGGYRRVKVFLAPHGFDDDNWTNSNKLVFFRGGAMRRHSVVEIALYRRRSGGLPMWVGPIATAIRSRKGNTVRFEAEAMTISSADVRAIHDELAFLSRPTSWNVIKGNKLALSEPPLRVSAREPFETIV